MKIDRLINIIMILLGRRRTSAKYLSDMFEVSLRTIYRDIETINNAGIPIVSSPGVGGGFYIMDEYKVDKQLFTDSDIVTLLMGLGSISSTLDSNQIANTLAKIKSFIPESKSDDITLKTNQVVVDLQPWMGNSATHNHIKYISTAIENRNIIYFRYINKNGEDSKRKVEPYRLILKNNNWYMQGFCIEKNDFRIFKMTRINKIEHSNEIFSPRIPPDSIIEFVERMKGNQCYIKLIIHKSIMDSVLTYCDSSHIEKYSSEHYKVLFPFIADDLGYGILLSFGDKCECLEPEHVRTEMAKRVAAMAKVYTTAEQS